MNEVNNSPTQCSVVVGEALDALTAENARLKESNAKMKDTLTLFARQISTRCIGCSGEEMCKNHPDCGIVLKAREVLAAEGGAK